MAETKRRKNLTSTIYHHREQEPKSIREKLGLPPERKTQSMPVNSATAPESVATHWRKENRKPTSPLVGYVLSRLPIHKPTPGNRRRHLPSLQTSAA